MWTNENVETDALMLLVYGELAKTASLHIGLRRLL